MRGEEVADEFRRIPVLRREERIRRVAAAPGVPEAGDGEHLHRKPPADVVVARQVKKILAPGRCGGDPDEAVQARLLPERKAAGYGGARRSAIHRVRAPIASADAS